VIREKDDLSNDRRCGFSIITARDIDLIGAKGIIDALKKRVGQSKVYISLDIDSLDPAFAPGKLFSKWPVAVKYILTGISSKQQAHRNLVDGQHVRC
jgi:hypothetical protein